MKRKTSDIKFNRNHKVKVSINGERQKDMFQYMTSWQSFVYRVKSFFRNLFIGIILVSIIGLIVYVSRIVYPVTVYEIKKEVVQDKSLENKISELENKLVEDIFIKESGGNTEDDALITFDPNPKDSRIEKASVGGCQFKIPTMQEQYIKYYGVQLTRKEAVMIALDDMKCKEVMHKTIFAEQYGWQKWYTTCTQKIDCKARLAVISELKK